MMCFVLVITVLLNNAVIMGESGIRIKLHCSVCVTLPQYFMCIFAHYNIMDDYDVSVW